MGALTLRDFADAVRLKTIAVAFLPVGVGAFFLRPFSEINLFIAFCLVITVILLQIGTNLMNDAFDFERGADKAGRKGDLRFVAKGVVGSQLAKKIAILFYVAAFLPLIPILSAGHFFVIIFYLLGVIASISYTAGRFAAAYNGYGELVVFLFYGPIGTLSTAHLLGAPLTIERVVASFQVGFFSALPLVINNIRDWEEDKAAHKWTLVARLGLPFGKIEAAFFIMAPFVLQLFYFKEGRMALFFIPLCLFPMAALLSKKIAFMEPSFYYNKLLKEAALFGLIFSFFLVIGAMI